MKPLDPRLLRSVRAARYWVFGLSAAMVASTIFLTAQALLLAFVLSEVVNHHRLASSTALWALGAVMVVRVVLAAVVERYAHRAADHAITQLRRDVIAHVTSRGPVATDGDRSAALTTLVTQGLDSLQNYLMRYLPQLIATVVITPALILVVWWHDLISALILLVLVPLIPLFMALVGWTTQTLTARRLVVMQRLGDRLLDLMAGLPTLHSLGRAQRQSEKVQSTGEAYRQSTNKVLRQAFLSGMVLEMLATLSVAIVAVAIGFRLLDGLMDLRTGLAVLILAPEIFAPLRMVGQHFHASADGLAAVNESFTVLDQPARHSGNQVISDITAVQWCGASYEWSDRSVVAPSSLDALATEGSITALVGDNGAGKSTALALALGLRQPTAGTVRLHSAEGYTDITDVDRSLWHRQVAWVPQRPVIVPGTLRDNAALGCPGQITDELLDRAARAIGFDVVVANTEQGWQTTVGRTGHGISAGQRQRLALVRAWLAVETGARVVFVDEPSAHLDESTENAVSVALRDFAQRGALVVVIAHRPSLQAIADTIVTVGSSRVSTNA